MSEIHEPLEIIDDGDLADHDGPYIDTIAWALLLSVTVIDGIWAFRAGFLASSNWPSSSFIRLFGSAAALMIPCGLMRIPRYSRFVASGRLACLFEILSTMALMILFASAALVFQYLAATQNSPLVDAKLIALDQAVGFHWPGLYNWHMAHPALNSILALAYQSYAVQCALAIVALGALKRTDDIREFTRLFMCNVIIVVLVSAFFPASNPIIHFGVVGPHEPSPWSAFYVLREGHANPLDLDVVQGIISLPSLHAAQAFLFAYSFRHIRWLFPIAALWNLVMTYSAILFGAHYLVDIIAGIALSIALIGLYRFGRSSPIARSVDVVK